MRRWPPGYRLEVALKKLKSDPSITEVAVHSIPVHWAAHDYDKTDARHSRHRRGHCPTAASALGRHRARVAARLAVAGLCALSLVLVRHSHRHWRDPDRHRSLSC